MDDLISRQVAIAYACSGLIRRMEDGDWRRVEDIREDLKNAPSVEPEIIRCKQCKHFIDHRCRKTNSLADWRKDDDFCSFAERRTDD